MGDVGSGRQGRKEGSGSSTMGRLTESRQVGEKIEEVLRGKRKSSQWSGNY